MSLETLWAWIGDSELAFQIGATWWFPLLESIHVLAITLLVGAIIMVDVRLLGWAGKRYSVQVFVSELTPWAWAALVPAVITGLGLFISRPAAYAANPAFQIKLSLLLAAALNVYFFHRGTRQNTAPEAAAMTGRRAMIAGAVSLLVWLGIILAGRWVGHIN